MRAWSAAVWSDLALSDKITAPVGLAEPYATAIQMALDFIASIQPGFWRLLPVDGSNPGQRSGSRPLDSRSRNLLQLGVRIRLWDPRVKAHVSGSPVVRVLLPVPAVDVGVEWA